MAEFVEVMRKIRELCNERTECAGCIMMEDISCGASFGSPCLPVEEIERRVAQWEAAKAKYPSWAEAWRQLFPESKNSPCPKVCFGVGVCDGNCRECDERPIPAEIAEKLGIKPKEVNR